MPLRPVDRDIRVELKGVEIEAAGAGVEVHRELLRAHLHRYLRVGRRCGGVVKIRAIGVGQKVVAYCRGIARLRIPPRRLALPDAGAERDAVATVVSDGVVSDRRAGKVARGGLDAVGRVALDRVAGNGDALHAPGHHDAAAAIEADRIALDHGAGVTAGSEHDAVGIGPAAHIVPRVCRALAADRVVVDAEATDRAGDLDAEGSVAVDRVAFDHRA